MCRWLITHKIWLTLIRTQRYRTTFKPKIDVDEIRVIHLVNRFDSIFSEFAFPSSKGFLIFSEYFFPVLFLLNVFSKLVCFSFLFETVYSSQTKEKSLTASIVRRAEVLVAIDQCRNHSSRKPDREVCELNKKKNPIMHITFPRSLDVFNIPVRFLIYPSPRFTQMRVYPRAANR